MDTKQSQIKPKTGARRREPSDFSCYRPDCTVTRNPNGGSRRSAPVSKQSQLSSFLTQKHGSQKNKPKKLSNLSLPKGEAKSAAAQEDKAKWTQRL
jgi:hypothetical protein